MDAAPVAKPSDHSWKIRWGLLLLISTVMGVNYYAYDALSSIKSVLNSELGITSTEYGLIVGFYAFPNTFLGMTVIGGIFLDRFGIRKTGFWFTLFCALGVLLTAFGTTEVYRDSGLARFFGSFLTDYSPEVKMMILGRLLFGLGAETSIVVINKVIAKWFKGKELAFAFAINLAIARIGTAVALIASPILIKAETGWTTAIWVAGMLMSIGVVLFVVYAIYDKKIGGGPSEAEKLAADEVFRLRDVFALLRNRSYIAICLLCVTFYSAVFPFQSFCPDFLYNKFEVSLEWAGTLTSSIIWGTILFTPLFGFFVDRRGRRASLMVLGSALLFVTHLTLSLTAVTPYVAMFVLGIAFSLVPAAMWPAVALIVEEKRLGTAYGLMTSIQNFGLWLFPILAGVVTDRVNGVFELPMNEHFTYQVLAPLDYTQTILMFAALGILGLGFAWMLKLASAKDGSNLELPSEG